MKKCRGCNEDKGLDGFYRHSQAKDGHLNYCKECVKKRVRKRARENTEKIKAEYAKRRSDPVKVEKDRASGRKSSRKYQRKNAKLSAKRKREWVKKNPEKSAEIQKRWREKNKDKLAANRLLQRAVAKGLAEKKPCEICGNINSEAHHEDYFKPLEVIWLCKKHHGERHRKYK